MSARHVVAIVVTVGALAWLGAAFQRAPRSPQLPDAGIAPEAIADEAAASVAIDETQADRGAVQPDPGEAREPGLVPQPAAFVWHAPAVGWPDEWRVGLGGSQEACVRSRGGNDEVCRMAFENRDPDWAPEAELRIREIVADKDFLRPTREKWEPGGPVECFTTVCRVVLDVDRPALVARLGHKENPSDRESGQVVKWIFDRLEEIRLALVIDGLVEEGAETLPLAAAPVPDDTHARLAILYLYRCPRRFDVCPGLSR